MLSETYREMSINVVSFPTRVVLNRLLSDSSGVSLDSYLKDSRIKQSLYGGNHACFTSLGLIGEGCILLWCPT